MRNCFVVPTRGLDTGKSRLAPVLAPARRRELNLHLLCVVLEAVARARTAGEGLIVVSPDAAALARARGFGADILLEPAGHDEPVGCSSELEGDDYPLNRALHLVARRAVRCGAQRLTVVPADLPFLIPADVEALAAAGAGGMGIAPDRNRRGTNGLAVPLTPAMPFGFGTGSFERHLAAARLRGIEPAVIDRPGLACDLDLPGDWHRWRDQLALRAA